MWLPGSVYESLPYCYLLVGCLLIGGTFYLGPGAPGAMIYLCSGALSIVAGASVWLRRQAYRAEAESMDQAELA